MQINPQDIDFQRPQLHHTCTYTYIKSIFSSFVLQGTCKHMHETHVIQGAEISKERRYAFLRLRDLNSQMDILMLQSRVENIYALFLLLFQKQVRVLISEYTSLCRITDSVLIKGVSPFQRLFSTLLYVAGTTVSVLIREVYLFSEREVPVYLS